MTAQEQIEKLKEQLSFSQAMLARALEENNMFREKYEPDTIDYQPLTLENYD